MPSRTIENWVAISYMYMQNKHELYMKLIRIRYIVRGNLSRVSSLFMTSVQNAIYFVAILIRSTCELDYRL